MRVRIEHLLRGIVIAVLALLVWQSLGRQTGSSRPTIRSRGVGLSALAKWTLSSSVPVGIRVQLDTVPVALERAWLGALAGAGSRVTWSGALPALMIDAQPVASPIAGTRVLVAAPIGSKLSISDAVGPIDTMRVTNSGVSLSLPFVAEGLSASANGSLASTAIRDSLALRRVLVIGAAGWESKFVTAALEESGWKVDAVIRTAPGVDLTQGSVAMIDTSRYSAVVALDGAAAPYANRIIEFARTGGGVVLAPQAASVEAMALLRAGVATPVRSGARAIQEGGSTSLSTLPLSPITVLRSDAVPLEKRAGAVATAARRLGPGRILQVGDEDTWRWRMGGDDAAVRAHRAWWTGLVSTVAYASLSPRSVRKQSTDEAPTAALVAAVGGATPGATADMGERSSDRAALLFVLLVVGLLSELSSRRLRGGA
jgi:hypothetical protein